MTSSAERAVAIVGIGAILPDAPDATAFWANVRDGHYSISDVDPARWDPALYYDADPKAPDKTYSDDRRLGARVGLEPARLEAADPAARRRGDGRRPEVGGRLHPQHADGLRLARAGRSTSSAPRSSSATRWRGEKHYLSSLRLAFPELARDLEARPSFAALPADVRAAITGELHTRMDADLPPTTEDTMPGELSNCLAGRVANLFNLRGPELHRRRGLRVRDGGDGRVDRGPARATSSTSS